MSGQGFIMPEPPATCELCGQYRELRPYGPKGERVCLECAKKDPEAMNRGIDLYIFKRAPPAKQ